MSQESRMVERGKGVRFAPRRGPLEWSNDLFGLVLNIPALIVVFTLVGFPLVYSLWLSLHKYNLGMPDATRFVGLDNYIHLLRSSEFWTSLRRTLMFTFASATLSLTTGLVVSLLLNERFKGRALLRSLVLIPWAMPPVVNGIMWKWIFDAKAGILNGLLWRLGIIESYKGWLVESKLVTASTIWAYAWNITPFAIIVFLSALQAIPEELYDAAKVDRAGILQRFRHVTLPWMLQPIMVVVIVQTTYALRAFDIIYTLTYGGPAGLTTFLSWRVYLRAFQYFDFGLANTYGFWLAIISMIFAVMYFRVLFAKGRVEV